MKCHTTQYGFCHLLTTQNVKIAKSNKYKKYLTAIMHLAPHKACGIGNVCASASPGCIAACLNTSGHGKYTRTQTARINRTKLWFNNRTVFSDVLCNELCSHIKKAHKLNRRPAIRLNGTSDIIWEKELPWLFTVFPDIQFYDYTKHAFRCLKKYNLPANYHLTFSRSETNEDDCEKILADGKCSVIVVFRGTKLPRKYKGRPVFDAEKTDLRFLDPIGKIGGVLAKGRGKHDKTGFVI